VKWIERIVLIPRWGWLRYPFHVNSIIKDDVPLPPPASPLPPTDDGAGNVTAMRMKRDGR
jgi:hypothetical protein